MSVVDICMYYVTLLSRVYISSKIILVLKMWGTIPKRTDFEANWWMEIMVRVQLGTSHEIKKKCRVVICGWSVQLKTWLRKIELIQSGIQHQNQ